MQTADNTGVKYPTNGPRIQIDAIESGPPELMSQLPVTGRLDRILPGPDRPDYYLGVLEKPIPFVLPDDFDRTRIKGVATTDSILAVELIVICPRAVGAQVSPTMQDLAVNVAYVVNDDMFTDPMLDLNKVEYIGVGNLNVATK